MEEILARHRKEQRDLQAKITQKKKSATKKTRKGVNDECDRLQQELADKQQAEIAQFNGGVTGDTSVEQGLENLTVKDDGVNWGIDGGDADESDAPRTSATIEPSAPPPSSPSTSVSISGQQAEQSATRAKKPNRHKARLARRAAEQAAQSELAAEEAAKQTNHRGNEREVMNEVFKRLNLKEVEINPDGHCLYSAVAHHLDESGLGLRPDPERILLQPTTQSRIETVTAPRHDGYRAVRAVTADYITTNKDDFEPFMEEPLDEYTRKIKLTAEWGGQLELQAIARAYGVNINVIQGDGRIEKIEPGDIETLDEEERGKRVIWLAYYRHSYGLGEHYNALLKQT